MKNGLPHSRERSAGNINKWRANCGKPWRESLGQGLKAQRLRQKIVHSGDEAALPLFRQR